jgi:benzoyl-CoA reductase/2-hydroxyglutaryl-CoA dehydratase subunit BcrC/BadD/HgdB
MKRIVYSCPYVPAEWIVAHGLSPNRIVVGMDAMGGVMERKEGACPYMRAFVNEACSDVSAIGIILTTVCDQMRRGAEFAQHERGTPVFLMHVPTTWQTAEANGLYVSELMRLGRFMEMLGGKEPLNSVLSEVMAEHDVRRSAIQALRGRTEPRQFSEAIAKFHATGAVEEVNADYRLDDGVPVALLGGPLMSSAFGLFDLVEEFGGTVVLDGSETGERTMPRPFDRRRLGDEPLLELADAYFGGIPDAFRRPNSELYAWLKREVEQRDIRGIMLVRHLWCDTWHAEVERLREWLAIPLLDVDMSGEDPVASNRMRIQAFLETIA